MPFLSEHTLDVPDTDTQFSGLGSHAHTFEFAAISLLLSSKQRGPNRPSLQ